MQKFIVPMILAAFVLAGCGAKSGGTPITPSDSEPEATSVPSESGTSEKTPVSYEVTLPVLHLAFYEKFADEDVANGFKNSFIEYLDTKAVCITSITIDLLTPSANGETFATDLETFEGTSEYSIDAILGAKGNLGSYITTNFSTLKNDGTIIEYPLGEKTDRRLYIRNDAADADAVAYLSQYIRHLAGLPEEEETSEDTSSEETSEEISEDISEEISEEISGETSEEISEEVSGETSGETSEESEVVDLHVVYYEKFADASVQSAFETAFEGYLTANGFTKGDMTYKSLTPSANGSTFATDLETFQGTVEYTVDVLLGAKANLGSYITTNYSVYQVEGANFEYTLGTNSDRRLYVRNDTVNTVGVEALVAYFTSIK